MDFDYSPGAFLALFVAGIVLGAAWTLGSSLMSALISALRRT